MANSNVCLSFCLSVPPDIDYKPLPFTEHDYSEPPKFTVSLADRAATVGYSTKLLCSVRGSPKVGQQPPLPPLSTNLHYLQAPITLTTLQEPPVPKVLILLKCPI